MLEYPKSPTCSLCKNRRDARGRGGRGRAGGDLQGLGGIIDGEGSVLVNRRVDRKNTPTTYTPRVTIANADTKIINECRRILDELGLAYYVHEKTYQTSGKRGRKETRIKYDILMGGYKRCSKALPALIPYIRSKRKRAELLLELVESRLSQKTKCPCTEHELGLVKEIRRLNRQGHEDNS